ncbi:hypothetical protein GCM10027456_79190 [Kineosporia babensis]
MPVELDLVAAEQMDPLLAGPGPEGAAGLGAVSQQKSDRVEHGSTSVRGRWRVQGSVDCLQRCQQASDLSPVGCVRVVVLQAPQIVHPEVLYAPYLGRPQGSGPVITVHLDRPRPASGSVSDTSGGRR